MRTEEPFGMNEKQTAYEPLFRRLYPVFILLAFSCVPVSILTLGSLRNIFVISFLLRRAERNGNFFVFSRVSADCCTSDARGKALVYVCVRVCFLFGH